MGPYGKCNADGQLQSRGCVSAYFEPSEQTSTMVVGRHLVDVTGAIREIRRYTVHRLRAV